MAVRVYDQERDLPLNDRFESGIARHCGSLAAAVGVLLDASEEVEHIAARAVARQALDDYDAWIAAVQHELAVIEGAH